MSEFKNVTFKHPFTLRSIGREMPAGTYRTRVDASPIRLGGHPFSQRSTHFYYPAGIFDADHLGGSALLSKGELEEALSTDRKRSQEIAADLTS